MAVNEVSLVAAHSDLIGHVVKRSFTPGFIVLSFAISYVGALTTLELLHRRTAPRGLYNWFLLIGSAITMGACAIWSMHYIGNRAIVLENGEPELQIAYNSGFTALSFFVPILVLLAAFRTTGCSEAVSKVRVGLGGALAGLAICGMHYLGQAGIDRYTCVYQIPYVVGSIIVAVIASVTALTIFFVLRAAWTNSWWKRALSAILLAGAVSGMHWLASIGTNYRLHRVGPASHQSISRDQTIIIVIVLSMSACVLLLLLSVIAQRRRSRYAKKAQEVVLACVYFDAEGRLMVTPEGLIPNQKITNALVERSFDDAFDVSHPIFSWIFRVSRNWPSIVDLVPDMRRHLHNLSILKSSRSSLDEVYTKTLNADGRAAGDRGMLLRELFCVAALDLATQINEPLENLGVLYDEVLSTGVGASYSKAQAISVDLEQGMPAPIMLGRGKLLFTVRVTNKTETAHLQAAGFRFANPQNILDILARALQVDHDKLKGHLQNMNAYAKGGSITAPGVHLGCFAVRANVSGGFEVLAQSEAKNQLPMVQLPLMTLEEWQRGLLRQLDGCSAATCMKQLQSQMSSSSDVGIQTFASQLFTAITRLANELPNFHFLESVLVARPVAVPCHPVGDAFVPGTALLIAFHQIVAIETRAPSSAYQFSSLSFFQTRQHVYKNSRDHTTFAKQIRKEFVPVLRDATSRPSMTKRSSSREVTRILRGGKSSVSNSPNKAWFGSDRKLSVVSHETGSEKNLFDSQGLGGIMVSQEISVDVREVTRDEADMELQDMNTTIGVDDEVEESVTYVDKLFALCIEGRQSKR